MASWLAQEVRKSSVREAARVPSMGIISVLPKGEVSFILRALEDIEKS